MQIDSNSLSRRSGYVRPSTLRRSQRLQTGKQPDLYASFAEAFARALAKYVPKDSSELSEYELIRKAAAEAAEKKGKHMRNLLDMLLTSAISIEIVSAKLEPDSSRTEKNIAKFKVDLEAKPRLNFSV